MTEQVSSATLPYDYDDVLDTVLDIGCRLLEAGAEVRRVEDTVERLCFAYGAHSVDVFSIVVLVGVTVEGPNGRIIHRSARWAVSETALFVLKN